jgi:hypothetical protein
MATKTILTIKAECINKHEQKNGGMIALATDVENGDDNKVTARKVLNYRTNDLKEVQQFVPGEKYTITITK